MTLDLSPELEIQIERAARLRGTNVPSFIIEAKRRSRQWKGKKPTEAPSLHDFKDV